MDGDASAPIDQAGIAAAEDVAGDGGVAAEGDGGAEGGRPFVDDGSCAQTHKLGNMIVRNLHIFEIASLRDAEMVLIYNPQTALCLSGVIKIKCHAQGSFAHSTGVCTRLRGLVVVIADNHIGDYLEWGY